MKAIARKALVAALLLGTGFGAGWYFSPDGTAKSRPTVVIEGPSLASPGDKLIFTGERSSSARPLEWWSESGELLSVGNTCTIEDAKSGTLVVTAIGSGWGPWKPGSDANRTVVSKVVTIGGNPTPPGPVPPGPTPPDPTPAPTPQAKAKFLVVLYDSTVGDPRVARVRGDRSFRTELKDSGVEYRDYDACDQRTKDQFPAYFRNPPAQLPVLLIFGADGLKPIHSSALPATTDDIRSILKRYQ